MSALASLEPAELAPVASPSLSDAIYRQLCERLMRGQLKPEQRLKIRDLAQALGVSETPVREAIFQLVREGAVELKPRHYLRVRRLSLAQYMELREIRLQLEPLAAERALPAIDRAAIAELARSHRSLIAAEKASSVPPSGYASFCGSRRLWGHERMRRSGFANGFRCARCHVVRLLGHALLWPR